MASANSRLTASTGTFSPNHVPCVDVHRRVVILSSSGCAEITLPSLVGRFTHKTFQTPSKPLGRNWCGSITEIGSFILIWSPYPNKIHEWNRICMQEWSGGVKSLTFSLGCTPQGSVSNLSGSCGPVWCVSASKKLCNSVLCLQLWCCVMFFQLLPASFYI